MSHDVQKAQVRFNQERPGQATQRYQVSMLECGSGLRESPLI
jgi:hypothetical protein